MTRGAGAAPLLLLPALLLGGCVDFVDPGVLGLARDTRFEITFELAGAPALAACAGPPAPAGSAVLCVEAVLVPGVTPVGERLRVTGDTLRVMDAPLAPVAASDSLLRWEARFVLPRERLNERPLTARFPTVEGVEGQPAGVSWYPVGQPDGDTLRVAPGAGATLRVAPPGGPSLPPPGFQFWGVTVSGDTATATYNGSGIPAARYVFPSEVLGALGGAALRGELRWTRDLTSLAPRSQVLVRFRERLRWTILR